MNLTVTSTGTTIATTNAQAVGGGLYGETKNYSESNVGPVVTAALSPGGGQLVSVAGNITINATEYPEGDANTRGVSGGVIGVGGSESRANINPSVTASVTGSQVHAGGSLQVLANAQPFVSSDAPDYSIQSVDPSNDTLNINNHGLQTGDTVEYNPNGHTLIGGLVTTYVDNTLGDAVTLTRPYNVIRVNGDNLALGSSFSGANVDSHREIITFTLAHNFQTGDAVSYHPESGSVPGLTDGSVYYVVVLDDSRIKLVSTHAEAVSGATPYGFTPGDISSDTIHISGSGFTAGQALQYHAPQPKSFPSAQVDFLPIYNGDGSLNVAASQAPSANNIYFLDSDGNPMWSGFFDGDIVVYHVTQNDGITPGTAIGPLVDGHAYRVVTTFLSPSIQLKNNTVFTGTVDFVRSALGRPDHPARRQRLGRRRLRPRPGRDRLELARQQRLVRDRERERLDHDPRPDEHRHGDARDDGRRLRPHRRAQPR